MNYQTDYPHLNLSCCIKTCEYFILTIKEIVKPGQSWNIWKETAYIELCSFFIDILAFELGKLCPGWGFCFPFSTQGPEFCTEKMSQKILAFCNTVIIKQYELTVFLFMTSDNTCIIGFFQLKSVNPLLSKKLHK